MASGWRRWTASCRGTAGGSGPRRGRTRGRRFSLRCRRRPSATPLNRRTALSCLAWAALASPFALPAASAAADQSVQINGNRYYLTSNDGVLHPTPAITPATVPLGIANLVPVTAPRPAVLPTRVMLDEEGYITPVKNQGGRGSGTIFATVGAIESEYLREYGLGLNLSENT